MEQTERLVVALGGNAILQPGQRGTYAQQTENVRLAARQVAALVRAGYRVVVTHGNGPQVGNILLQNERAAGEVEPMPLDVCGAESQGFIGYMLVQALQAELGPERPVAALVTRTVVREDDPAFREPSKPIGPFYGEEEAARLAVERGYRLKEDAGRGWRRVVPSPEPVRIVEREAIRALVEAGVLVVAAGGGGVPVVERRLPDGRRLYEGVEAVVDKDLGAQRLAVDVGADRLLMLTDVSHAYLHYRRPDARPLERLSRTEARGLLAAGEFAEGSMGPKVRAAVRFLEAGGREAVIASLAEAERALAGATGTHVLPDAVAVRA
ncbi:MAG: carbamate kinase [Firmicutes bacterium]|nr:carbamate kinase [Bacillota bacterium]